MPRDSRIERARERARHAKTTLGAVALLVFGVAFVGAKVHAPGHTKGRSKPLGAPASFKRSVRENTLRSGQIAPPAQPPVASSSTS